MEIKKLSSSAFLVNSDSGNAYKITVNGDSVSCSCQGFRFNRKCKHVDFFTGQTGLRLTSAKLRVTADVRPIVEAEKEHLAITRKFLDAIESL